jgi:hypothetical protein
MTLPAVLEALTAPVQISGPHPCSLHTRGVQ